MSNRCTPRLGETARGFNRPNRAVDGVFIHCTAASRESVDAHDVDRWHRERGWSCIGYHYLITTQGEVQYGRSLEITPAAQSGFNTGTIAICLNGLLPSDFNDRQYAALRRLCDEIDAVYGKIRYRGHTEVSAKACPVFAYASVLGLDDNGYRTPGGGSTPDPIQTYKLEITRATVGQGINHRHPHVLLAQGLLTAHGANPGPVDGIAGNRFHHACQRYQRSNGLVGDGVCGPSTWAGLEDAGT